MTQIRLDNVGIAFAEPLFSGVSLTIADTHRLGIVGNNGCGKSTLLKCIAGELEPAEGKITRPKNCRFGFIEQTIPEALLDKTLADVITEAIPREERDYGLWKVEAAMDSFHAPKAMRAQPIRHLSGGWQRLALLARTWVSDPDVLLLDEPTNHLDLEKVFFLETWLNEQVHNTPMLCISHDRRFLDTCTNATLFLRPIGSASFAHPFSKAKDLLLASDEAASTQREKERKEIDRLKKSAHELRQIGVNKHSDLALRKSVQIAKRAETIQAQMTQAPLDDRREIRLGNSGTHARQLIRLENVTVANPEGLALFKIDRLVIGQGERLVILGPNGSGKSMFVETLHRAFVDLERARETGIVITPTARPGYVDQHLSALPASKTVREFIAEQFSLPPLRLTSKLVETGFPFAVQDKKIGVLSYGERSRLMLLSLRLLEPNFYLMDEPTNHLDIAGQEQLESEILRHGAGCILVSHDRSFVANLGTRFLVIRKGKLAEIDSPEIFYKPFSAT